MPVPKLGLNTSMYAYWSVVCSNLDRSYTYSLSAVQPVRLPYDYAG